ncbi:MAG TPA: IS6 family transposase [Candidatus Acidoferrales bacterium]|nr:IS6 family transposase [Candidatus Acidoferrales bacterium]
MFTQLTELLEAHNVFVRERKPTSLRAMGIALLYFGLSCRQTAEALSFSDEASHEAVRQWYHRAQKLLCDPSKRYRPTIAIDETKFKVEKRWYFLWAVDTERRELLCVEITPTRGGHDASRFIRRVLKTCTNTPTVLVDGGPWYPRALTRLRVPWEWVTFGKRNVVEQWFSIFKQRVKRFYRRWPHNARAETATSWCEAFVALYNLKRA